MPQPPLTPQELKTILLSIRDFALRKAQQFVETDDPTRKVYDETRASRIHLLVSTADTASQMLNDLI